MPKLAMKNLHVPLPEPLYVRLRREAERSRRPATDLAREAIDLWLQEQRNASIHEAVLAYAQGVAGTIDDLDPQLESAGIESLRRPDRAGKKGRRR